MSYPRHFLAAGVAPEPLETTASTVAHVLDHFFLVDASGRRREWVTCVGALGQLFCLPGEVRALLPAHAQGELSYHELSTGTARTLHADGLYVLDVQLLEQPADAPGLNDPVYLYGPLAGPFTHAGSLPAHAAKGQLTTTRADVLDGFVLSQPFAFSLTSASAGGPPRQALHLMLAAGSAEETARGQGLVLAYPLLPFDAADEAGANAAWMKRLLGDVLEAMASDAAAGSTGPWRALAELLFTRAAPRPGQDAPLEDWVRAAKASLAQVPGWPPERSQALRGRLSHGPKANTAASAVPRPPPAVPPRPPPRPRPSGPPEWMQDFLAAHTDGHRPRPKLSAADWRADFEGGPKPPSAPSSPSAARPDWMKDFE